MPDVPTTELENLKDIVNQIVTLLVNVKKPETLPQTDIDAIFEKLSLFTRYITLAHAAGEKARAPDGKPGDGAAETLLPFTVSLMPADRKVIRKLEKSLERLSNIPNLGEGGYAVINLMAAVGRRATVYDQNKKKAKKAKAVLKAIDEEAKPALDGLNTLSASSPARMMDKMLCLMGAGARTVDVEESARLLKEVLEAKDAHSAAFAYMQFGEMMNTIIEEGRLKQFAESFAFVFTGIAIPADLVKMNRLMNAAIENQPMFTDSVLASMHAGVSCINALLDARAMNRNVPVAKEDVAQVQNYIFNDLSPNTERRVSINSEIRKIKGTIHSQPREEQARSTQLASELQAESDKYFKNPAKNAQALTEFQTSCRTKVRVSDAHLRKDNEPSAFFKNLEKLLIKIDAVKLIRYFRGKGLFGKSLATLDVERAVDSLSAPPPSPGKAN